MIEAFILLVLVAGVVGLSYRWPDVEKRLWPDELGIIPQAKTAEPAPASTPPPTPPAAPPSAPTLKKPAPASTILSTKPLPTEPTVAASKPPAKSEITPTPVPAPAPVVEAPAESTPAEADPAPSKPPLQRPGDHVTGSPALPSQRPYYDATGRQDTDDLEELMRRADQSYKERNYAAAEKACLKILVADPRNHKYMTRIGQIYQEMGNLEDAKEAFEAATALDPKNFFVLNRLSEVTRQLEEKSGNKR